ncbi:MAG: hypothetical protein Q9181_007139 [Wetmoreana brouardii]
MSGSDTEDPKLGEIPGSVVSSIASTANDASGSTTNVDKHLLWFMEELDKLEAETGDLVDDAEAHADDLKEQKNYLIEAHRAGLSCPQLLYSGRLTARRYHSVSAIAYQLRKLEKAGVDVY